MSSPRQKAKELVDIYVNQQIDVPYIDTEFRQCIGSGYMRYYSAKKCALIAVKFARENPLNTEGYNKYLDEVRQEIEKL
jgi:hypothetical protein